MDEANFFNIKDSKKAEIKAAFDLIDTTNKGQITLEQLTIFLKTIGYPKENDAKFLNYLFTDEGVPKTGYYPITNTVTKSNVKPLIDSNASDLTYDKFSLIMEEKLNDEDIVEQLHEAFKIIGKEDRISIKDFAEIMSELDDSLKQEEIIELIDNLLTENEKENPNTFNAVILIKKYLSFK